MFDGLHRGVAWATRPLGLPEGAPGSDKLTNWVFFLGVLIRIIITLAGEVLDAADIGVKYTDIDYWVFTDAAREVWEGRSPYDRATYRYTPLLAWITIPNIWTPTVSWGKHLFTLVDIGIGVLSYKLLTRYRGLTPRRAALFTGAFLLHPFTINISTRGNADSLVCFLVLATLVLLMAKRTLPAAVMYGLAVHTKIYPIVYALPLVFMMDADYAPEDYAGLTYEDKEAAAAAAAPTVAKGSSSSSAAAPFPYLAGYNRLRVGLHNALTALIATSRSFYGQPTLSFSATRVVVRPIRAAVAFLTPRRLTFGAVSAAVFLALTAFFYALYGWTFLYETYLYHLVRTDNRHNFSPYFYDLYLRWDRPVADRQLTGLITFVPQFGTLAFLGWAFHKDAAFALFMQTLVFVVWNKVITVQYFHWYLCLLPLILPQSRMRLFPTAALLCVFWLVTEINWSVWAGPLEGLGQATFLWVWGAGLAFFGANVALLVALLKNHTYTPLWRAGKPLKLEGGEAAPRAAAPPASLASSASPASSSPEDPEAGKGGRGPRRQVRGSSAPRPRSRSRGRAAAQN